MAFQKTQESDEATQKEFKEKCGQKHLAVMPTLGPAMEAVDACKGNAKLDAAMAVFGS